MAKLHLSLLNTNAAKHQDDAIQHIVSLFKLLAHRDPTPEELADLRADVAADYPADNPVRLSGPEIVKERKAWQAHVATHIDILTEVKDATALSVLTAPLLNSAWPDPVKAAAKQEPGFASALVRAWHVAQDALNVDAIVTAIQAGHESNALMLLRATRADELTMAAARPLIQQSYLTGVREGVKPLRSLGVQVRAPRLTMDLNGFNQRAVDWAQTHAADLVVASDDQREIIRLLTAEAETGTATVDQLAAAVKTVVGLTTQAATAVTNYMGTLLADESVSPEQVVARTQKYADAKLSERAMTIARTETMAATNAGQMAAWGDAVTQGLIDPQTMSKTWIVTDDDRLCDICDSYGSSDPIGIDEAFDDDLDTPPAHPNCRCTIGLVRDDS